MEKLQAALEKAREKRQARVPEGARREDRAIPAYSSADQAIEARWQALTPLTLDADQLAQSRLLTHSARAEAMPFDMLRTKIQLMMKQNGWTRLAITSPEQGCGKTTLSCNLALGFGRQKGMRTMLLDFDMRRPNIAKALGHPIKAEIEDFLSGETKPEEHLRCLNGNLALSMFSTSVADPMAYLMNEQTSVVLDGLQQDYRPDLMIFDLPPMLSVDETRAILKYADCALIVVRAEQTRISALDQCEREVAAHCNVLGVVLNSCRFANEQDQYYGYAAT